MGEITYLCTSNNWGTENQAEGSQNAACGEAFDTGNSDSQLCHQLLCSVASPCSALEMLAPFVTKGFGNYLVDPLTL